MPATKKETPARKALGDGLEQITEKRKAKPRAKARKRKVKVKAHWRSKDPVAIAKRKARHPIKDETLARGKAKLAEKRKRQNEIERDAAATENGRYQDTEPPLPDDPDDEIDQRTLALAQAFAASEIKARTYGRKLTMGKVKAALKETGGIVSQAAETLGCARSGLNAFIYRNKAELDPFLAEVREEICDAAESTILVAIVGGDREMAKWYLSRMGGKRGYAEKRQLVDEAGDPYDLRQSIVSERPVLRPDAPIPASPIL